MHKQTKLKPQHNALTVLINSYILNYFLIENASKNVALVYRGAS